MRVINKVYQSQEMVTVNKVAVEEEIKSHSVDSINKEIQVTVELKDVEGKVLDTEGYFFKGDKYVENVTVDEIWILIDQKRNEVVEE